MLKRFDEFVVIRALVRNLPHVNVLCDLLPLSSAGPSREHPKSTLDMSIVAILNGCVKIKVNKHIN